LKVSGLGRHKVHLVILIIGRLDEQNNTINMVADVMVCEESQDINLARISALTQGVEISRLDSPDGVAEEEWDGDAAPFLVDFRSVLQWSV